MSLDLTIQGDAQAIRDIADWLAGQLASAADDADVELAYLVGDVGVGAYEIGQGASPSSVGVEVVAGTAGATVAGGAAVAMGGPVVWVAAAAVVGGYATGKGGEWLWETAVSLENREGLDDFVLSAVDDVIIWDDHPRIPR